MGKVRLAGQLFLIATAALVVSILSLAWPTRAHAEVPSQDLQLAAFWNSDEDLSDTLYMSTNGVDFQKLSIAYQTDGNYSDHVAGKPPYVHSLHDPGIFYKDGSFWMLSGFVQNQSGLGWRFTPMLGSSKDLVNWSYPNSGSPQNLAPLNPPLGSYDGGAYDSAGTDGMADDDGSVWIVTTLGYFGAVHGRPQVDTMMPYIVEVSGLQPGADQTLDPGAQPRVNYGSLMPINLPQESSNWLDPSLYKENGVYYLSIKKNGVTNQIYSITDLSEASNKNAWNLVNGNVVTGFEGPCLSKLNGFYHFYTDKLKDWPPDNSDGTAGEFVTDSASLSKGWTNTRRITTTDVDGRTISNRHGSVVTIDGPAAKNVIWKQRVDEGYAPYRHGANGWVEEDGKRFWYDDGVQAQSKEVWDSEAWYWFDKDGTMAQDKDVYIPSSGKWVRYDENGHMRKGEDYRDGGWYYFDPVSGAMMKGVVYIPSSNGKWVYYDYATGRMAHGETLISDSFGHNGWYLFDYDTGAMFHGDTFVSSNGGKWVRYDPVTGAMVKGLQFQDDSWYYFLPESGAMQKGNVWVPKWGGWHWFDSITGRG